MLTINIPGVVVVGVAVVVGGASSSRMSTVALSHRVLSASSSVN